MYPTHAKFDISASEDDGRLMGRLVLVRGGTVHVLDLAVRSGAVANFKPDVWICAQT